MPRPRARNLFELGGQWIAREPGSPYLHRYWTPERSGRTRRASLGTQDLEEAKKRLAEIVVRGAPKTSSAPLSAVLISYFEERTDKLPSKKHARLGGRTLPACWGQTVRVEAITEAKQKEFAEWSLAKGHSLGYISRNLSVLAAALAFSKIEREVIVKPASMMKKWVLDAKAPAKRFTPSDDELAKVLAEPIVERFWRWTVISLLTGARPEAAVDLTPAQRRRDSGLLDLNPEGRMQNKKYRACVREPQALTLWLDKWEADIIAAADKREPGKVHDISHETYCGYASVESVQTAFERLRFRETIGLPRLSAYSYSHKVATVMRKARLPREEQDMQLGHARPTGYGEWEPDYLQGVADALDAWWVGLDAKVTAKSLFAPAPAEGENVKVPRTT